MKTSINRNHQWHAAALLGVLMMAVPETFAQPTIALSNLGSTHDTSYGIGNGDGTGPSFLTGSQDVSMDSATLMLDGPSSFLFEEFGISSLTYHAYIFIDVDGSPSSLLFDLGSWTIASADSSGIFHDFLAPANSMLSANTSYWLLATEDAGFGSWDASSSSSATGSSGWSIGSSATINGNAPFEYGSLPLFAVNIQPVPEPSQFVLAGLAACFGAVIWRRRTNASARN